MPEKKHLTRRHGPTWYAIKSVPRELQGIIRKRHLLKSLGTDDLTIARSRRYAALTEFEAILCGQRRGSGSSGVSPGG
jgi:hypothetical protein